MRNVLATDIKNNIRSIRFILGIFLIVSATLMSEHEMLQRICRRTRLVRSIHLLYEQR